MRYPLLLFLLCFIQSTILAQQLSVQGNQFLLDGKEFDMWGIRVASASQTDSLTEQLIANLDDYKRYGVNTVSVYLQGSSGGFSDPFRNEGKALDERHTRRLKQITEACQQRDMVVVVGIFYQRVIDNRNDTRKLNSREAIFQAVETTVKILEPYENIIINIANEQNSSIYRNFAPFRFNEPQNIIDLCQHVKKLDPNRLVGGGGYHDSSNVVIGKSEWVDVLLFDTFSGDIEAGQDSGWHYDYFRESGVPDKPMVNVELFGGWTKQFVPPGVYTPTGKKIHLQEIEAAKKQPGLYVHLHSNPWCQGPADGYPVRYHLGGDGTAEDPGIRWWFEAVRSANKP
ncbi:MAG: cellulase family glycosylhydrolase [Tunicatimonas sp.]|uniref:cellulase family glycosylhydrolase n=1 Tax=Tunicatimonas sp. TaxID=1940096 RepID=UPI003C773DAD